MTDEAYREFAKAGIAEHSRRPVDDAAWPAFAESLFFVSASIEDSGAFAALGSRLDTIEHERGLPGNRIYYLARAAVDVRPDRRAARPRPVRASARRPRRSRA